MISTFGDTLHDNGGTHLNGGIAHDEFWQGLHQRVVASALPLYTPPSGPIET